MQTVSILGCGWIGFELAQKLFSTKKFIVKASTTTKNKLKLFTQKGFLPYLINSQETTLDENLLADFLICDTLIISFPPKKSNPNYLNFLETIHEHPKTKLIKQIIFISSTSVYPSSYKNFKETESISLENTSKKVVFEAEQIFLKKSSQLVILRCSGLMGYDRIAGKYFSNRKIEGEKDAVNYVHRDDVIKVISLLLEKNILNKIYNLCSPSHPSKKEVYFRNADKYGFEKPLFINSKVGKKRLIDGSRISSELNYGYMYPNPLEY